MFNICDIIFEFVVDQYFHSGLCSSVLGFLCVNYNKIVALFCFLPFFLVLDIAQMSILWCCSFIIIFWFFAPNDLVFLHPNLDWFFSRFCLVVLVLACFVNVRSVQVSKQNVSSLSMSQNSLLVSCQPCWGYRLFWFADDILFPIYPTVKVLPPGDAFDRRETTPTDFFLSSYTINNYFPCFS